MSVVGLWLIVLGVVVLGGTLIYGLVSAGRLRRDERARLDRNTEAAQYRDDQQKRLS